MAILAISKLGNPILRQQAQSVSPSEIKKAAFQQLIDDMFETMYDEPGIGLAAPQVGRSQQLVVMDCPGEGAFPRPCSLIQRFVSTGPSRWKAGKAASVWTGCGAG